MNSRIDLLSAVANEHVLSFRLITDSREQKRHCIVNLALVDVLFKYFLIVDYKTVPKVAD